MICKYFPNWSGFTLKTNLIGQHFKVCFFFLCEYSQDANAVTSFSVKIHHVDSPTLRSCALPAWITGRMLWENGLCISLISHPDHCWVAVRKQRKSLPNLKFLVHFQMSFIFHFKTICSSFYSSVCVHCLDFMQMLLDDFHVLPLSCFSVFCF